MTGEGSRTRKNHSPPFYHLVKWKRILCLLQNRRHLTNIPVVFACSSGGGES